MSKFKSQAEVLETDNNVLTANIAVADKKFKDELMNCARMHDERDQYKKEADSL
jgi:hypothetical protein